MKKLYKRDTTGSVREWSVEVVGAKYRTISGALDGNHTTSAWTTAQPKNLGRSNELSAEEQAMKEVDAMYTKKRKEGYFDDIANIDKSTLIKPMLAEKFKDYFEDLTFPLFSQPKLDGFRCNATKDGLFARKGDRFISCPHIEQVVAAIAEHAGVTFDGELYNHSLKDNFNKLQSLINKKKPEAEDFDATLKMVQYHIYDIVDPSLTFGERHDKLKNIFATYPELEHYCVLVDTRVANTLDELDASYAEFLTDGYEGQMIRTDENYQHKRSQTLLKRKEFQDAEFPIVSIDEGIGNRSGMAGRVTCSLQDGRTFGAGIKGGVEVNKKLLEDAASLIGKQATIIFQHYTPDGIPRFPVFKGIREDI